MSLKIVVHEAEEGGFWAEAPALAAWLEAETAEPKVGNAAKVVELMV